MPTLSPFFPVTTEKASYTNNLLAFRGMLLLLESFGHPTNAWRKHADTWVTFDYGKQNLEALSLTTLQKVAPMLAAPEFAELTWPTIISLVDDFGYGLEDIGRAFIDTLLLNPNKQYLGSKELLLLPAADENLRDRAFMLLGTLEHLRQMWALRRESSAKFTLQRTVEEALAFKSPIFPNSRGFMTPETKVHLTVRCVLDPVFWKSVAAGHLWKKSASTLMFHYGTDYQIKLYENLDEYWGKVLAKSQKVDTTMTVHRWNSYNKLASTMLGQEIQFEVNRGTIEQHTNQYSGRFTEDGDLLRELGQIHDFMKVAKSVTGGGKR